MDDNPNKVKCPKCNKYFKNRDSLKAHTTDMHRVFPQYMRRCRVCLKIFMNTKYLRNHYHVSHPVRLPSTKKKLDKKYFFFLIIFFLNCKDVWSGLIFSFEIIFFLLLMIEKQDETSHEYTNFFKRIQYVSSIFQYGGIPGIVYL